MSAYAGGSLFGSIFAGTLPTPNRRFGPILVVLFAVSGLLLMPFGFLGSMWIAAALALVIGTTGRICRYSVHVVAAGAYAPENDGAA